MGHCGLLASADIKNGVCTYGFAPHLRLKLHNPRIYAKLNLRLQNRFKSQYALVLWEVCFDYFDTDRDQGETPFIPLETSENFWESKVMSIQRSVYSTELSSNRLSKRLTT